MSNRWQRAGGGSYNPAAPKPARRFGAPGAAQREYQASEEQRNRAAYIASAKAKSQKTRGYFDDSDDDEDDELLRETTAGDDGDDDRPRPERLDESARDAVDDAAAEAVARERAAAAKPVEDAKAGDDRGDDVRYVDGKAVVQNAKKRKIDGLAPVDHRAATYETVDHAFLDLAAWNAAGAGRRRDVAACADGTTVRPAASFSELFGAAPAASWLLKAVAKFGFERPTPVQALAAPAPRAGHLPRAAPVLEARARREPLGVVAVFGGSGKYEMGKALQRRGADVAVATPGRLIELVADGTTELQSRCSFLVVDEADRMFELGFAEQLKGLAQHVRPQRQCAFTTATLPPKLDGLVRGAPDPSASSSASRARRSRPTTACSSAPTCSPARRTSSPGSRAACPSSSARTTRSSSSAACGSTSTSSRETSNASSAYLVAGLHGDKDQGERAAVLAKFKKHATSGAVLVATDVAARLDVENVTCVVNFDTPTSIEQYVHRVGRTGRRSRTSEEANRGEAHTLLDRTSTDDESFARMLRRSRFDNGAPAPPPGGRGRGVSNLPAWMTKQS
ncbi:DEAD box helicase-like protein [Aureococcus anophagefferens]|nr:DEAD box helicase-like protein [Aureococcus anophagefferens]